MLLIISDAATLCWSALRRALPAGVSKTSRSILKASCCTACLTRRDSPTRVWWLCQAVTRPQSVITPSRVQHRLPLDISSHTHQLGYASMRICMRVATKIRWSMPGMDANPDEDRPHIATPWLPPTSCRTRVTHTSTRSAALADAPVCSQPKVHGSCLLPLCCWCCCSHTPAAGLQW
jgi:hypothetical protein